MIKPLALALSGLALAACSQMSDYYPNAQTVEIDGRAFFVAPQPQHGLGVYLAGPNEPQLGETLSGGDMFINVALPVANVRAMEAATGCRVRPESVQALASNTLAAVTC